MRRFDVGAGRARFVSFGCAVAIVVAAGAQPEFVTHAIHTGGDPYGVFAADVDGDGDIDVLSASLDDDAIRWYENDGQMPPGFMSRDISLAADGAWSVFASDVNGDGHTDVLSASRFDNAIRWYKNDGQTSPSFTSHDIYLGAQNAISVFAADLDGDGDTDVLSASCDDDRIRWYENDGQLVPAFTLRIVHIGADCAWSVFASDVDDDGDTDVLSASRLDDAIRWYENDGQTPPGFSAHDIFLAADDPFAVFAADVDGDGDTDVLSASYYDDAIRWYENNGQTPPGFTARDVSLAVDGPYTVFAADVDGDGDTDVLSASVVDDTVYWHENNGQTPPAFTSRAISVGAIGPVSVFAADVDGDGDSDALSASANDDTIRWHECDLIPTRLRNITKATSHHTMSEAVGSADSGDLLAATRGVFADEPVIDLGAGFGGKDLSLSSWGDLVQPETGDYTLEGDELVSAPGLLIGPPRYIQLGAIEIPIGGLVLGQDDGSMMLGGGVMLGDGSALRSADALGVPVTGALSVEAGADAVIDAPVDAQIAGGFGLETRALLDVQSSGVVLSGTASFTDRDVAGSLSSAFWAHIADVDGDGHADILSAAVGVGRFSWHRSDGGTPPSFTTHTVGSESGATAAIGIDVNGDGHTDIVTAARVADSVSWWEHDGTLPPALPSFTQRPIGTTNNPIWIHAADVDGDLDIDVLSAATHGDEFAWYENQGGAVPAWVKHELATPNDDHARCIMTEDFDGDGDTDLVTAAWVSDVVSWWESDGATPPVFTERTIITDLDGAMNSFPADLDSDGDIDVLTSTVYAGGPIDLFLSDGQTPPAFTRRTVDPAGGNAAVIAQDVDGDGDLDITAADTPSDIVVWYENTAGDASSFTKHTISTACDHPTGLFGADLDGDGDSDLATASNHDGTIRWHENTPLGSTEIGYGAVLLAAGGVENRRSLSLFGGAVIAGDGFVNKGSMDGYGDIDGGATNDGVVTVAADMQLVGDCTNNGTVYIQNGTFSVLGMLTNNGEMFGDSFGGRFYGGLFAEFGYHAGPGATLAFPAGGTVGSGGGFVCEIDSNERFDMAGATLRLNGLPSGGPQTLEVMSVDIGPDPAGLDRSIAGHYPIDTLRIGPTPTTVDLADLHDNDGYGQAMCEAVYTRLVIVHEGATLRTIGCRVYYDELVLDGDVDESANLVQYMRPCNAADLADPYGMHDLQDINAFVTGFLGQDPIADVDGNGIFDLQDISVFVSAFLAGCP